RSSVEDRARFHAFRSTGAFVAGASIFRGESGDVQTVAAVTLTKAVSPLDSLPLDWARRATPSSASADRSGAARAGWAMSALMHSPMMGRSAFAFTGFSFRSAPAAVRQVPVHGGRHRFTLEGSG